jgi:hypothetical protein
MRLQHGQHGSKQLLEALHDVTLYPGRPILPETLQSKDIAKMCMDKEAAGLSRRSNTRDLCVTSNKLFSRGARSVLPISVLQISLKAVD